MPADLFTNGDEKNIPEVRSRGLMRTLLHGLVGLFLLAAGARADVRVVGSDLLAPALTPALGDFASRNDLKLTVALEGSRDGWQVLQSGAADIGLLAFPPGTEPPADPFVAVPVAYHVVVVLAPAGVSLTQISFAQLAGVFGQGEAPAVRRWAALGVTGDQAASRIVPWVLAPPHCLVRQLFSHCVLQGGALRSDLTVGASLSRLIERLGSEGGGLALAPVAPADDRQVKTLAVSHQAGGVAYAPSALNVGRGDYPLRWPVYLVFRRSETRRLYPLLRHLLGDECAELYRSASLLPVPSETRAGAVFNLEQL